MTAREAHHPHEYRSDSPSPRSPYSRSLIVLAVATALCRDKGTSRIAIERPTDSAILLRSVSDGSLLSNFDFGDRRLGDTRLTARSRSSGHCLAATDEGLRLLRLFHPRVL